MNFLKTLFWVVVAIVAVIFSTNNWSPVTLNLWGGLQADVKLPVLLLLVFLLGLLPTFIWHHAKRWQLKRRLTSAERALADVRGIGTADETAPLTPPAAQPGALA